MLAFAVMLMALALTFNGQRLAQVSTASINGVVHDPTGASIPNAKIVMQNVKMSVENTTVSNGAVIYSIFNANPGH